MAISVLFKINGRDWTGSILTPFKGGRPKLWSGEDTGRTLSGEMQGTLIGIFPKFTVQFHPESEIDLSELMTVLDGASQEVSHYNPITRSLVNLGTYTSDYEYEIISLNPFYSSISVSFISLKKE